MSDVTAIAGCRTGGFDGQHGGITYLAKATVDPGQTITGPLAGSNAALFAVSSKPTQDFASPTNDGGKNVYDLNRTVPDGANESSLPLTLTFTDVHEAPVVTGRRAAIAPQPC